MRKARVRSFFVSLSVLALAGLSSAAFAQSATPAPIDYGAMVGTVRTEIGSALVTGLPAIAAIIGVLTGLGIVWRLMKRGAKTA